MTRLSYQRHLSCSRFLGVKGGVMLHGSRGLQAHRQVWPYFSGSHLQGRPRQEPVTLVCISRFSRRALVSSVLSPVLKSHLKTPNFEWLASSATFPPPLPAPGSNPRGVGQAMGKVWVQITCRARSSSPHGHSRELQRTSRVSQFC